MSILDDPIPILSKSDMSSSQLKRLERLSLAFQEQYSRKPLFYACSPGRVNLIGEHIDYSSYSVLPMAIQKDTVIAVAITDSYCVELANTDSRFSFNKFEHLDQHHAIIDPSQHEWSNYFKCGYKGMLDSLNLKNIKGMQVMVDGNVPTGSGLSSSSAFVCCSALATLYAQPHSSLICKGELTATVIKAETLAGVEIGGMDQSISIMAVRGSALLIDFYPLLNATLSKLPIDSTFIIAHTGVTADKHVTAPKNYNLRVVEVRLASALLAKKLGLMLDGIPTLKIVQQVYIGLDDPIKQLKTMIDVIETCIDKSPYTINQLATELGLSADCVLQRYVGTIKIEAESFKLYSRAKHVFNEALRVHQFSQTSTSKDLGRLMSESHYSCRDLFECSCVELDTLTTLARESGALGSRLTGAGWGGCTVSLVPLDQVDRFMNDLKVKYYVPRGLSGDEDMLFATVPSIGSYIYKE